MIELEVSYQLHVGGALGHLGGASLPGVVRCVTPTVSLFIGDMTLLLIGLKTLPSSLALHEGVHSHHVEVNCFSIVTNIAIAIV